MRAKKACPYVHRAIAATGRLVEWNDPKPPTWDGARWHFARLATDFDVLHEVAHWIVAPPLARAEPNYALGTDPDGGPVLSPDPIAYIADEGERRQAVELLLSLYDRSSPEAFRSVVDAKGSHEEELASVVTIILIRRAGLPWAAKMRSVFGRLVDGERSLVAGRMRAAGLGNLADNIEREAVEDGAAHFWGLVADLVARGVDLEDPLAPFERSQAAAE